MDKFKFLDTICKIPSVSGNEEKLRNPIKSAFEKYCDDIEVDKLGNVIAIRRGKNNHKNIKIMLAAHMDEIGLMVKYIEENGFIYFTNVGGIDPRTLVGQEVVVHGKKDLFGVIGSKPPHLQEASEIKKAIKMEEMYIDLGFTKDKLNELINIGDVITINRNLTKLHASKVTGRALDDKAGLAAMYLCAQELNKIKHEVDVYFVSTVQEEVGTRGALTSTYDINPNIGIAIDVGFGRTPELDKSKTIELGKGAGITLGGNIHPNLRKHMIKIAKEYNLPYQIEVNPGPTGTDARAIQITRAGIPSLCLSIPLRYMHTSVETVDMEDVSNTAKLLAFFIASISGENLEGLLCY